MFVEFAVRKVQISTMQLLSQGLFWSETDVFTGFAHAKVQISVIQLLSLYIKCHFFDSGPTLCNL